MSWWSLIPLAMSAIQGQEAKKDANNQRALNAELTRWSPWTGMQPAGGGFVKDPSMAGALAGGALNSYQMNENQKMNDKYADMMDSMAQQNLQAQANPQGWAGMSLQAPNKPMMPGYFR